MAHNPFSDIDSRIKILVCLLSLVMVLTYKGFLFHLLVILLCLFACSMMKITLRAMTKRFWETFFMAGIIIILKSSIGDKDGLREGFLIASRILSAVSIVAVMGFSTPFNEFIAALSWFKVPKGFVEVLMFAYRYIFVLLEDATVIYNSQKNRLGYISIKRGLKSFGDFSGTLILKAFEKSHNITVAMIQRGYEGNMPQPRYKPFRAEEVLAAVLFIITMAYLWKI